MAVFHESASQCLGLPFGDFTKRRFSADTFIPAANLIDHPGSHSTMREDPGEERFNFFEATGASKGKKENPGLPVNEGRSSHD
jgi:hypothetical protein